MRQDGRGDAQRGVARQHADEEGGRAHDHDGDEEGVLAAHAVAKPAEDQRAEGPDHESRGEGEQREDERRWSGSRFEKNCFAMIAASEP